MSETDRLISELILYIKISALPSARQLADSVIDSFEKATVYSKLDGKTPQSRIELDTGIRQSTISDWAKLFVRNRLVAEPSGYFANYKALFTLEELGIDINSLKKKTKTNKDSTQSFSQSKSEQSQTKVQ